MPNLPRLGPENVMTSIYLEYIYINLVCLLYSRIVSFGRVCATTPLFIAVWKNQITMYSGAEP